MSSFLVLSEARDRLLTLVRQVARVEVMPRFLRVGFDRKQDGSLLTAADLAAQAALQAQLPDIIAAPVLAEEMTAELQYALWQNNPEGLWVVDPLDGTTNFVHGIPHFAISVAFFQQGRPRLAAIYNPISDEMFSALVDQGAYLNQQRLPLIEDVPLLQDAIAGVEVKCPDRTLFTQLCEMRPYHSQRTFGASTLDWCYLAVGRLDIYLHCGQKLWDYAAGSLVLAEAGGRFATLTHDDYWQDNVWQRSVIAARDKSLFFAWQQWIRANQSLGAKNNQ